MNSDSDPSVFFAAEHATRLAAYALTVMTLGFVVARFGLFNNT